MAYHIVEEVTGIKGGGTAIKTDHLNMHAMQTGYI